MLYHLLKDISDVNLRFPNRFPKCTHRLKGIAQKLHLSLVPVNIIQLNMSKNNIFFQIHQKEICN